MLKIIDIIFFVYENFGMENLKTIGNRIKEKRLELNLRMEDVAFKAGTNRSTLSSLENGKGNCSISLLLAIFEVLDLDFSIVGSDNNISTRERATRTIKKKDKKVNRFIIMCVEQFAKDIKADSKSVYKSFVDNGLIEELTDDYEDLHGMSTLYLNELFKMRLYSKNETISRV